MRIVLIITTASLALAACMPGTKMGDPIRVSAVDQIKIGSSTQQDVISLLGEPAHQSITPTIGQSAKARNAHPTEVWTYDYVQVHNSIIAPYYLRAGGYNTGEPKDYLQWRQGNGLHVY